MLIKCTQSIIYKELAYFKFLKESDMSVIYKQESFKIFISIKLLNDLVIFVKPQHFDIFNVFTFFTFKKELAIYVNPHFSIVKL